MTSRELPTLDREGEVWRCHFPGLGSIAIAADGSVDVVAEASSEEDLHTRQRALRYGWAEGLSLVRRGFRLAAGAAVVHPGTGQATLLTGDPHDAAVALADLAGRGWLTMSDRFTPVTWEQDHLIAYPREAPILIAAARTEKCGMSGEAARNDTDALMVDVPRASGPAAVTSVAAVTRRRTTDDVLTNLTGQKRFEAASQLIIGGVLAAPRDADSDTSAAESMAETLRLASLRFCTLRAQLSDISSDVDALLKWLEQA